MGLTYVTTSIRGLTGSGVPFEDQFLVDTGAIDCMAPASKLHQAGIPVEGKDSYEMANSALVEYPYGYAKVSFMGSETVTRIIFGEEDCEPLLGVVHLKAPALALTL